MIHRNITTEDILELTRTIGYAYPELQAALLKMLEEPKEPIESPQSHWTLVQEQD